MVAPSEAFGPNRPHRAARPAGPARTEESARSPRPSPRHTRPRPGGRPPHVRSRPCEAPVRLPPSPDAGPASPSAGMGHTLLIPMCLHRAAATSIASINAPRTPAGGDLGARPDRLVRPFGAQLLDCRRRRLHCVTLWVTGVQRPPRAHGGQRCPSTTDCAQLSLTGAGPRRAAGSPLRRKEADRAGAGALLQKERGRGGTGRLQDQRPRRMA